MFITKKHLSRRTLLRGMGAAVALPLLDSMVPALARGEGTAAPVRRLGFMYAPNGANQSMFMPAGEGTSWEFSPTLAPLQEFRDRLFIPSYLANRQSEGQGEGGGDHARACAGWLNGAHAKSPREKGENAPECGQSADQMAAAEWGTQTRLASLELALESPLAPGACGIGPCDYHFTIAWRTPTTPLAGEYNPRIVFERLFGDGGTREQQLTRLKEERSLLDSVNGEVKRLTKNLGGHDRNALSDYIDAIRDSERRIEQAEKSGIKSIPLPDRPLGVMDNLDELAKLMIDLQVLAYQADVTRVVSLVIGREQGNRTYPNIGIPENHHSISHHDNDPEKLNKQSVIDRYHAQFFAYLLGRLKSTKDGAGNLLDNSLFLYGTGLGDSNVHAHHDLNLALAGGPAVLQGGRHVKYPRNTPMSNLLVSMLDKVGLSDRTVGDSTGKLAAL